MSGPMTCSKPLTITTTDKAPNEPVSIQAIACPYSIKKVSHRFIQVKHEMTLVIETDRQPSTFANTMTCEAVYRTGPRQELAFDISRQAFRPTPTASLDLRIEPKDLIYLTNIKIDGEAVEGNVIRMHGALRWHVVSAASLPHSL